MAVMIENALDSATWAAVGLELVEMQIFELGPGPGEMTVRELVRTLFAIRSIGGGLHPGRYTSKEAAIAVLDALLAAHLLADHNRLIAAVDAAGAAEPQTRAAFVTASTLTSSLWAVQAPPHYEIREGEALAEFLAFPVGRRRPRPRVRFGG
ncbi:hypothetical protein [Luteibacter sp. ME-Dv--P-043b]|uniref:hypothetical protein n=1 Tax=Luteibacter sp. ME-Dv--P-043b TaxID=3040291 RepID=UPI0025579DC1|nr:hypothetical protein [Luteibacter sp. ME-Dv--P-043b]